MASDKTLPLHVQKEFDAYLKCGRLEHGFLRVRCEDCFDEHLVAFSCKGRGFCPSCGARRMVESAALLLDEVLPEQPMRQWLLCTARKRQSHLSESPSTHSAGTHNDNAENQSSNFLFPELAS